MTEHDDALPDLDLGVLGEGVDPSAGQWDAIGSIAAHRRRRRSVVLSAAAVLILIAGTATVLLSRSDDGSMRFATVKAGEPRYVLPPAAADLGSIEIELYEGGYLVAYELEGKPWLLQSNGPGASPSTVAMTRDALDAAADRSGAEHYDDPRFGRVNLVCTGTTIVEGRPDGTLEVHTGPLMASWMVDDQVISLESPVDAAQPCDPTRATALLVHDQVAALRVVDAEEFRRFVGDDQQETGPATSLLEPTASSTATTATQENPPAAPDDAQAQIELAVKGFDTPAADGTWPHLEDGVARADEYLQRQTAAEEQSGMSAVGDPEKVHEVVSITFESDEAAWVQYDITVTLPGGRVTVPHRHRFILQDGVWKMSYDSYLQLSGLACTSPGGYGESCQTGSYQTFGKTGG
jgi:hypothetical protein